MVEKVKGQGTQTLRNAAIPLLMEPPINYAYKTSLQLEIFSVQQAI